MNQSIIQRAIVRVMPAVHATGLQSSTCTFQSAPRGPGYPANAPWVNVSGLANIVCQFGPDADMNVTANQQRTQPQNTDTILHRLELDGYYSTLETGWRAGWRVMVAGLAYNIVGVESDSQSQVTRLKVRLVSF